ncbi:hypothetical protein ABFS83_12G005100 [Erythranthe nasuta]
MVLRRKKSSPLFLTALKIIAILISSSSFTPVEGVIGMSWGRQTTHRLIPSMVVDLLLQNGIRHVKLFSPSDNVLKAFAGGEIVITLIFPNEGLVNLVYPDIAAYWIDTKMRSYLDQKINIKTMYIGSEPFTPDEKGDSNLNANQALRNIQDALKSNGHIDAVATTAHFTDMLAPNIQKPSEADFHPNWKNEMVEFVGLLNRTNAPFVMDMFPMYFVSQRGWDIEFAFMDNMSNFTIVDDANGFVYTNVFEFVYDSFLTAIAKAGSPNLELKVGQIGWPTDGFPGATTANAERFYKGFLPYVAGTKGTPLRPGISIDVFIYSLADENMNTPTPGFQRHWGVYRADGEPKFNIDFTGQGRDIFPTTAKGVVMMPKRWCVFNGDTSNLTKVKYEVEDACKVGDCTTLSPGGSCDNLDFNTNVSYVFNEYYQAMAQSTNVNGTTCDFQGLGKVVMEDPSVGSCRFPLEILSAETADTNGATRQQVDERFRGLFRLLPLMLIIFVLELI